jgi:hypothetical protein
VPVLQPFAGTERLSKTSQFSGNFSANSYQIPTKNGFENVLARTRIIDEKALEFQKHNHKELELGNPFRSSHPNIYLCDCAFAKFFRGSEIGLDLSGITTGIWDVI